MAEPNGCIGTKDGIPGMTATAGQIDGEEDLEAAFKMLTLTAYTSADGGAR